MKATSNKLSIKTVILQSMVARAIKGAGQNKLVPLTSLMCIRLKDKQLTLITTDATNTLYITHDMPESTGDFYCVVQADQFSKLISKITSENINLEINDAILNVKGNGNYKIELPLDENGKMIIFPDPVADNPVDGLPATEINLADIKTVLTVNKAALAESVEDVAYTGYYVGDKVVSTDQYKICGFDKKLFSEPKLISSELMNLLDVMTEDKIAVYFKGDCIVFVTGDCVVFGHAMDDIDSFAIDTINGLLEKEFESSCKVHKSDLLAVLDRVGLFVSTYDNRAITLTFSEKGLDISSKKSNGVETLEYTDSKNFKPYTCQVDISFLIQQIKTNSADMIEIHYGDKVSIKLVDGAVTQLIALLENR